MRASWFLLRWYWYWRCCWNGSGGAQLLLECLDQLRPHVHRPLGGARIHLRAVHRGVEHLRQVREHGRPVAIEHADLRELAQQAAHALHRRADAVLAAKLHEALLELDAQAGEREVGIAIGDRLECILGGGLLRGTRAPRRG